MPRVAMRAFTSGGSCVSDEAAGGAAAAAWPLRQAGALAAIWQPVRRTVGISGVITVG